jgi:hypothetical protein
MFYVCALYSKSEDQLTIGLTQDLRGLVKQHKEISPDSILIFYECFISEQDAKIRDEYFNTVQGDKELRRMLKNSINNNSGLNWQNA